MEQATLKTILDLANRCKSYETALEIILNMCKRDTYIKDEDIRLICETVLGTKEGNEDVCV